MNRWMLGSKLHVLRRDLGYDHLQIHRAHESKKPYRCTACRNRFESEEKMLRHRHFKHAPGDVWICFRSERFQRTMAFFDAVAQGADTQTSSEVYSSCGYCGISCLRTNRKRHLEKVHGTLQCSGSAAMFFRNEDFCQHLMRSHAAAPNPFMSRLIERARRRPTHQIPLTAEPANDTQLPLMTSRKNLENVTIAQNVLTERVDEGADDHEQRRAAYEATKMHRVRRLAALETLLDSSSDEGHDPVIELPVASARPEDDLQKNSGIKREDCPPARHSQDFDQEHRIQPRNPIHAAPSVSNPPLSAVVGIETDLGVSQRHAEVQETSQSQGNFASGLLVTLFRVLVRWCRPKLPQSYSRLEWHCSCGQQFWGDFKNAEPEKLHRLVIELQQHGFAVDTTMKTTKTGQQSWGYFKNDKREKLPRIEIEFLQHGFADTTAKTTKSSGTSSATGTTASTQNTNSGASTSSPNPSPSKSTADKQGTSATASDATSPVVQQTTMSASLPLSSIGKPVYLELCINRSSNITQLGEIMIVDGRNQRLIRTDLELFGKYAFYS
jgi:hypothetical protein